MRRPTGDREGRPNGARAAGSTSDHPPNAALAAESASNRRPNAARPADACLHRGRAPRARRGLAPQRGQATIELLGGLPALLLLGLVVLQALAVGYASVLAGNAAEAGALALAGGGDARAGVRASLPGWSRARARVWVASGRVNVRLRPPSPLRAVSRRLEVSSTAVVTGP